MENNKGKKSYKVGYDKSKNNKKKTTQVRHNNVKKVNKKAVKDLEKVKLYDNSKEVNLEGYEDFDKFNFIENTSVLNLSEIITEDDITEDYGDVPVMVPVEEEVTEEIEPIFAEEVATEEYLPIEETPVEEKEEKTEESVVVEMNNNVENNEEVVSISEVEEIEEDEITEVLELDSIQYQDTNTNENAIPEMIVENTETSPVVPISEVAIANDNNLNNAPSFNNVNVSYNPNNKAEAPKNHFSFEKRVILMGCLTVISFVLAIIFCYQAINYSDVDNVSYSERSSITYSVCLNDNDYYKGQCQSSGMQYISTLTKSIPVVFNYNINYSSAVNYKLDYYILGKTIIYDRDDASKVLYRDDKLLSERKSVEGTDVIAKLNAKIDVAFKEKNDFVNGYKSKYALNSLASYDVVLYVDDGKGPREVASVSIPLSMQTFGISEETVTNENQLVSMEKAGLASVNTLFGLVGGVFGLIGAVILVKLIKLIYRTIDGGSPYEMKLNQILAEYDRVIVMSKSEYQINPDKQFIKLDSFFELLDARDTLEKPIIYERVNSVKSYFYVEDNERIYRYTMKESDFEKK